MVSYENAKMAIEESVLDWIYCVRAEIGFNVYFHTFVMAVNGCVKSSARFRMLDMNRNLIACFVGRFRDER
jgi:hypothetical protein